METITVFIPMTWKRRGGRKVIIAPDGGDAWAPIKARPDETLIRALAKAHWWNQMLEAGEIWLGHGDRRGREDRPQLRQPAAGPDAFGAGYPGGDS